MAYGYFMMVGPLRDRWRGAFAREKAYAKRAALRRQGETR